MTSLSEHVVAAPARPAPAPTAPVPPPPAARQQSPVQVQVSRGFTAPVFVGRDRELTSLAGLLAQTGRGQASAVLIEGSPGLGKSALTAEFLRRHHDLPVLTASGDAGESSLSFGLIRQLVSGIDETVLARFPLLSRGLPAGQDPGPDPLRAGAELSSLLAAQASPRGLIVVADDLHWADPESAAALLFACRRLAGQRVLVLLTARQKGLRRLGDGWARFLSARPSCARVTLAGLDVAELTLLAAALGRGRLSGAALRRVADYSRGNPLLAEALLAELPDRVLEGPQDRMYLPGSVSSVILARLAALPGPARSLVSAAAVLGARCAAADAVTLGCLARQGQVWADEALDAAMAAGFLVTGNDGSELSFADELTRRVVYADLSVSTRHSLHRWAASVTSGAVALEHRAAATSEIRPLLAATLDAGAAESAASGEVSQAVRLLTAAARLGGQGPRRAARLLSAVELLISAADTAAAQSLRPQIAQLPWSTRRDAALGQLALQQASMDEARKRFCSVLASSYPRLGPAGDGAAEGYLGAAGLAAAAAGMAFSYAAAGDRPACHDWLARSADAQLTESGPAETEVAGPELAGARLTGPGLAGSGFPGAGVAGPGLAGPGLAGPGLAGVDWAEDGLTPAEPALQVPVRIMPGRSADGLTAAGPARQSPVRATPGLAQAGGGNPVSLPGLASRPTPSPDADPAARLRALAPDGAACLRALAQALAGDAGLALPAFTALPDPAALVPAAQTDELTIRGVLRLWTGDLDGADDDLSVAVSRLGGGARLRFPGQALAYLAETEFRLGRWDDAAGHAEHAVWLAGEAERTADLPLACSVAAQIAAVRGDWELATARAKAADEAARAAGTLAAVVLAGSARSVLWLTRDDPGQVLQVTGRMLRTPGAANDDDPAAQWWRPVRAWALLQVGRPSDAAAAAAGLAARARQHGDQHALVHAARLRAAIALSHADPAQAQRELDQAAAAADRLPMSLTRVLFEVEQARCLARGATRPAALARLRAAHEALTGLGARPFATGTQAELAALGLRQRPEPDGGFPGASGLTAQELQVATLVAAGLSNREAAARLYLSRKTIEYHLARIFAKLGIQNRYQLAARFAPAGQHPSGPGTAP